MENAKTSKYPLDPGYYKLQSDALVSNNDEYRKLIGMLLYLAINTRPDISAAISILSQKISSPTVADLTEIKRVIRYLKGTRNAKLQLGGGVEHSQVSAFSDANWGEDRVDRKSNSGYVINLFGGPIAWSCRKQGLVALSSCEAEYIALSETTKELLWIRGVVSDFGVKIDDPIIINTDSQSCIAITKDMKYSNRTKHIDIKYHYVKDMCNKGLVRFLLKIMSQT